MSSQTYPPGWNIPISNKLSKNERKKKRKNRSKQASDVTDQTPANEPENPVNSQTLEASPVEGLSKSSTVQEASPIINSSAENASEIDGFPEQQLTESSDVNAQTVQSDVAVNSTQENAEISKNDNEVSSFQTQDKAHLSHNDNNNVNENYVGVTKSSMQVNEKKFEENERLELQSGSGSIDIAIGDDTCEQALQPITKSCKTEEYEEVERRVESVAASESMHGTFKPEPSEKHRKSSGWHYNSRDYSYKDGTSDHPHHSEDQHSSHRSNEEYQNSYRRTDNRYNHNQRNYGYQQRSLGDGGYRGRGRGRSNANYNDRFSQNQHSGGHKYWTQQTHGQSQGGNYNSRHHSQSNQNYQGNGQWPGKSAYNEEYYSSIEYPGDMEVSKEIVRIVRHGKYKWIKMDKEGYVAVDDIISDRKFIMACSLLTLKDIQYIVNSNDKKRFELKEINGKWFIKATQGHTVQVEGLALTPITDPRQFPNIFHGTFFESWELIKVSGLNRMKRNHIHFAIGLPGNESVISGMRNSAQVAIELDIAKALTAGIKFFLSSNNVVLSEGDETGTIHPKFFRRVLQLKPVFCQLQFKAPPDNYKKLTQEKNKEEKLPRKTVDSSVPKLEKPDKANQPKTPSNEPEFVMPSSMQDQPKQSYPPGYTPEQSSGKNKKKKHQKR